MLRNRQLVRFGLTLNALVYSSWLQIKTVELIKPETNLNSLILNNRLWHLMSNIIKSDVIPAVEAGIGIILVPLEAWSHEKKHNSKPENYGRLIEISTLDKLVSLYTQLP